MIGDRSSYEPKSTSTSLPEREYQEDRLRFPEYQPPRSTLACAERGLSPISCLIPWRITRACRKQRANLELTADVLLVLTTIKSGFG